MRSAYARAAYRTACLAALLLLPATGGRADDQSGAALQLQKKAYDGALATLARSPDDRTAHQVVGRYLCVVDGEWEKGLAHLAAGPDGNLKDLAIKSTQPIGGAAGLTALADAWSSAADKAKGKDQLLLRAGAAHCYSEAIPRLNGAEKARAEKRLAELADKLSPEANNRDKGKVAKAARARAGRSNRAGAARPDQLEIERAMAERVISLGGKVQVYRPGQQPSAEIGEVAALPPIAFLLYAINLSKCSNATDKDLEGLEALSGLIELDLSEAAIGDETLLRAGHLLQLTSLQLPRTKITDKGMAAVANLRKLERLLLDATQVSDPGVAHLRGLVAMKNLSLHNTKISDAGLANLAGMQQLARFTVNQTRITDVGVQYITALRSLRTLNLSNTGVTDAGLPLLTRLPLVNLHLEKTKVDDQGLQFLAAMTNLATLDLTGTAVSQQGLLALRARLPRCQITQ